MRVQVPLALAALTVASGPGRPVRLAGNPVVTPASSPTLGDNINGPSLIRVPSWIRRPLGRYYLYFAHHAGKFIRLAYADRLTGPWVIYTQGTLRIGQAPRCFDHVASPDVHADEARHELLMYFHCPAGGKVDAYGRVDINEQKTFLATSHDGLNFEVNPQPLGPAYLRVFHWGDSYYAIARLGVLFRSRDGRSPFEVGPTLIGPDSGRVLRHAAVELRGDTLRVYYSRIGDRPERILESEAALASDWSNWKASRAVDVLSPEEPYEGVDIPVATSLPDEARGRVREVRDPAIFEESGRTYLIYSIAGESGLAIAELPER